MREEPHWSKSIAPCSIRKEVSEHWCFPPLCAVKLLDFTLDCCRILAVLIHPSTTHKTGLWIYPSSHQWCLVLDNKDCWCYCIIVTTSSSCTLGSGWPVFEAVPLSEFLREEHLRTAATVQPSSARSCICLQSNGTFPGPHCIQWRE